MNPVRVGIAVLTEKHFSPGRAAEDRNGPQIFRFQLLDRRVTRAITLRLLHQTIKRDALALLGQFLQFRQCNFVDPADPSEVTVEESRRGCCEGKYEKGNDQKRW